VRELRRQIERKAYERHHIASVEISNEPEASSATIFKDPYFLDFLGLRDGYDEADLEAAILIQLKVFILELGTGFAFIERKKYWTELPPKAELERQLRSALAEARERLERRRLM